MDDNQPKEMPVENLTAKQQNASPEPVTQTTEQPLAEQPPAQQPAAPINIMPAGDTSSPEEEQGSKIFSKRNLIIGFASLAVVIIAVGAVLGVKAKGEYQGFIKKVESETQRIEQANKVRTPAPVTAPVDADKVVKPTQNKTVQPQPSVTDIKAIQDQPIPASLPY